MFISLIRFDYRLGGWGPKGPNSWLRNIWIVPYRGCQTLHEKCLKYCRQNWKTFLLYWDYMFVSKTTWSQLNLHQIRIHCFFPLCSSAMALSSALVSLKLLSRISFSISYVPKITKSKSAPPFTHTKTDAVWAFSYTFFCLHRYILVLCRLFVST